MCRSRPFLGWCEQGIWILFWRRTVGKSRQDRTYCRHYLYFDKGNPVSSDAICWKKENSQAVIANAWHHRSDAFSSIGTTLGIGGAILLGDNWRVLDPIAAVIVSILIVKVAFQLVIPAINDLLEKSLPTEVEDKILSIINETPEVRNPHNLCTRRIGNDFAIEVHIRVDGQITVSRAHELTKEIESKLRLKFGPATHIVLHVEPIKEKKDE